MGDGYWVEVWEIIQTPDPYLNATDVVGVMLLKEGLIKSMARTFIYFSCAPNAKGSKSDRFGCYKAVHLTELYANTNKLTILM